jgi:polar amino acid transport system substrate-binding protein
MMQRRRKPGGALPPQILLALAVLAAPCAARAACSRDIIVPVAPIGASVTLKDSVIGGIYPDMLEAPAAKAGCKLVYTMVPRARQQSLFEMGMADMLLPATRTPARDQQGIFVPLLGKRATLISIASHRPGIASAQELLDRRELRVAVVRGFDYGQPYQQLIKQLARQGRLFQEVDPVAVARLMQSGAVDVTIMGSAAFAGTVERDPRLAGMMEKLRFEPIPELPWNWSGIYISRRSLKPEDQAALRELLERVAKSNAVIAGFHRYHRADILAGSVRPL